MSQDSSQTIRSEAVKYAILAIVSTGAAYIVYQTYIKHNLHSNMDNKAMDVFPKKVPVQMKYYSVQDKYQKNMESYASPQHVHSLSIPSNFAYRAASIPQSDFSATFLGESSYRETIIFLLALAVNRIFPKQQLIICNTFKFGTSRRSYFCRFQSGFIFDNDTINSIENEMLNLSNMQLELQSKFIDYDTCLAMLQGTNQLLSAKLVESLNRPCFRMVGCDINNSSYYILQYRSTLNNTKYASRFKLHASDDNQQHFVMKFPHNEDLMDDDAKSEFIAESGSRNQPNAIRELYKIGLDMSKHLGIKSVSDINGIIRQGRFKELILISEAYHNRQIVKISDKIKAKEKEQQKIKIILISGPSSSGKTTFASKLGIQLRLLGYVPSVLEVDMFYRDRKDPKHPRDGEGNLNFEVIEALKIKELNATINDLLAGKSVKMPIFSFKTGAREGYKKEQIKLDETAGVLIMEGIFCLNPKLLSCVNNINDITFKIFICPISPFYSLDNFHFISEQVMRLIRRISRDHFHRGKDCDEVVFKWGQLKEGEDINIFPYVKYADAVFNSALLYELCVLKVYSYPLLQTVELNSRQYKDAQNLLSFLQMFFSMPDNSVPNDSLLMEFIGKSIFEEL